MTNAIPTNTPIAPARPRSAVDAVATEEQLGFAATLGFVQAASESARPAQALPVQRDQGSEPRSLIESSVDRRASDDARAASRTQLGQDAEPPATHGRERPKTTTSTVISEQPRSAGEPASPPAGTAVAQTKLGGATSRQSPETLQTQAQPGAPVSQSSVGVAASASTQPATAQANAAAASGSIQQASSASASRNDSATLLDRLSGRERTTSALKLKPPVPPKQGAALAQQVSRGLAQLLQKQGGSLSLKLAPESLGAVQIDLKLDSGRVDAVIRASDEVARGLLESQMSRLRGALEARGVTVDRLEVRVMAEPAVTDDSRGGAADSPSQDAQGRAHDGRDEHGAERRAQTGGGDRSEPIDHGVDAGADQGPRGAWTSEPGAEATIRLDTVV